MKKHLALTFFAVLPWILPAQYDDILKNPDVIWAAKLEIQYTFRPDLRPDSVPPNDFVLWKNFDPNDQTPREGGDFLLEKILDMAYSGKWSAWQLDSTERLLLPNEVFASTDMVITFDPETYAESIRVVHDAPPKSWFYAVRAKQLLFFNRRKGAFGLFTYAIAPVWHFRKELVHPSQIDEENFFRDRIPFWLKMPRYSAKKLKRRPEVNDPHIVWAAQIRTLENSPNLDSCKVLKNPKLPVMQVLLDRFLRDPAYLCEDASGGAIDFSARKGLVGSVDTISTFDPATLQEGIEIKDKTIRAEDLNRLRLIENWYWNDREDRLDIRLERFAPLSEAFYGEGRFRCLRPLFFHRIK